MHACTHTYHPPTHPLIHKHAHRDSDSANRAVKPIVPAPLSCRAIVVSQGSETHSSSPALMPGYCGITVSVLHLGLPRFNALNNCPERAHARTCVHIPTPTHPPTHPHTHPPTHTHTQTHTHTHTHTHTQITTTNKRVTQKGIGTGQRLYIPPGPSFSPWLGTSNVPIPMVTAVRKGWDSLCATVDRLQLQLCVCATMRHFVVQLCATMRPFFFPTGKPFKCQLHLMMAVWYACQKGHSDLWLRHFATSRSASDCKEADPIPWTPITTATTRHHTRPSR